MGQTGQSSSGHILEKTPSQYLLFLCLVAVGGAVRVSYIQCLFGTNWLHLLILEAYMAWILAYFSLLFSCLVFSLAFWAWASDSAHAQNAREKTSAHLSTP